MLRPRVIPCLLLKGSGFVKTTRFKDPIYLGDPINILRIFNEKEVDEVIILDILASKEKRGPNFQLIEQIVSEAFMPVCYGGGIASVDEIKKLLEIGVEKVSINTSALENIALIEKSSVKFGSQCIVASINIKKNLFNKHFIYSETAQISKPTNIIEWCKTLIAHGAGEIFINSVDYDGMMNGYDLNLLRTITSSVNVPVIACGGAGNGHHMKEAIHEARVSAVAAGSLFVFQGKHKGVLISYLNTKEIKDL
jgi:imidazole glycerol-phosphate synthase subunit HisF